MWVKVAGSKDQLIEMMLDEIKSSCGSFWSIMSPMEVPTEPSSIACVPMFDAIACIIGCWGLLIAFSSSLLKGLRGATVP